MSNPWEEKTPPSFLLTNQSAAAAAAAQQLLLPFVRPEQVLRMRSKQAAFWETKISNLLFILSGIVTTTKAQGKEEQSCEENT